MSAANSGAVLRSPSVQRRLEGGHRLSTLWWRAAEPLRVLSTSLVGGGLGVGHWFLNAQVEPDYARMDPEAHLGELAAAAGLEGPGVGMLTAVDVATVEYAIDGGVEVLATVGLGWPTWAAWPPHAGLPGAPDVAQASGLDGPTGTHAAVLDGSGRPSVGTINLFVLVPAVVGDAALVNLLATATEAKAQALFDAGVQGTGTASDAVCVATLLRPEAARPTGPSSTMPYGVEPPGAEPAGAEARFGGPRSHWGARVARAVHAAVRRGAQADWDRAVAGGWPRPPRQGP